MINKEARVEEANTFNEEHDCYIHVEMKGGRNCEIVIAGGGLALAHGIGGVIERISVLSKTPFEEVIKTVADLHSLGEEENEKN